MNLSPETLKTVGVRPLAAETGFSVRTLYRWAAEGIPGTGTVRQVRESTIATALQRIIQPAKPAAKPKGKRARAS